MNYLDNENLRELGDHPGESGLFEDIDHLDVDMLGAPADSGWGFLGAEVPFLIPLDQTKIISGPRMNDRTPLLPLFAALAAQSWLPRAAGFRTKPHSKVIAAAGSITLDIRSIDIPDSTFTAADLSEIGFPALLIDLGGTHLSAVPNSMITLTITYYTPTDERVSRAYVIQPKGVTSSLLFLPYEAHGSKAVYSPGIIGAYSSSDVLTGEQKHHLRVHIDTAAKETKLTVTVPGLDAPFTRSSILAMAKSMGPERRKIK